MIYNDSKYNQNWDVKALNQLGDFSRGKSKHRPRNDMKLFVNGQYPFIQTGEIKAANLYINSNSENYNEFGLKQSKLWNKDTLCITIAANIAETALLGYPMCFPDSVVGFTAFPKESSELFMHYVFTYIKKAIQNSASGSIQDNINIDYLSSLDFRIPKKPYQDKIAAVLSVLDAKIDLNSRINAELEAMAKTLYDYWFVQFDFPNTNGKPYKSSGGKMVWNKELKREIPAGWEVGSLFDIADYENGLPCQKFRPIGPEFLRVIKIKEMRDGFTSESEKARSNIPKKAIIEDGDVLFSWSASLEVQIWTGGKGALNQHIFKVTSKDYPRSFYFYQLKNYLQHFKRLADNRRTTMGHITLDHLKQSKIVLPPKDITQKLELQVVSLMSMIIKNQIANNTLSSLRDWLLPMLMNGQVRVS